MTSVPGFFLIFLFRICISENGYNDNELSVEILDFFDEKTKAKANGRYRRLLLDGFKSHMSLQFLLRARASKIIIVCYPPHCTHALQGLDVVIFACIKRRWGELLQRLQREGVEVDKYNFLQWYAEVRPSTMTKENSLAAFRVTGIQPFNPAVIETEKMAPSLVTSTQSSGPFTLPSQWLDIRAALRARKLIDEAQEEEEEEDSEEDSEEERARKLAQHITHAVVGSEYAYIADTEDPSFSSEVPLPGLYISPHHHKSPSHPSFYKRIDPQLLDSPTRLRVALGKAQDRIAYSEDKMDGMEVNLFVFHQYAGALQHKLYKKEHKPKKESERLFAGGQRHLTADNYIAAREREENEKRTTEALTHEHREWRRNELAERKAYKDEVDAEYAEICQLAASMKQKPKEKRRPYQKRESTPERFWAIRPKRQNAQQTATATNEASDDSEGGE